VSAVRVVGADLSLRSTGISDGRFHIQFPTSAGLPMEERLDAIVREVMSFVRSGVTHVFDHPASLVVIEDGATSRTGPGHEELAALRYMVRVKLWAEGYPFALVRPNTLKAYTTGNGSASKDDMVAALDLRYGTSLALAPKSYGRYDRADALALAAMGYDHLGYPLLDRHPASGPDRDRLAVVRWPSCPAEV
jgi:Holliday junction resolvasome RuvABC endonuclease subunit